MIHELLGQLTTRKETFSDNPISVEQMGELVDMVQSEKLTGVDRCSSSQKCSCAISREIRKDPVASHGHFTLNRFAVSFGKRVGSAGDIRR